MSKIDKKRRKLQERIDFLQKELTESLTKKSGNSVEIDVAGTQRKILEMRKTLKNL